MTALQVACDEVHELAEGPVWDVALRRLLWVDILRGLVLQGSLDHGRITVTDRNRFDGPVGAVAPAADGGLLVAGERRLWELGPDGTRRPGPELVPPGTGRRLNDGRTDPAGRFLVGTLSRTGPSDTEVLAQIGTDGAVALLDDDLQLSNGLAFSPDGRRLFSVDTLRRTVFVRTYDPAGRVGDRRVHLVLDDSTPGVPDGIAMDAAGYLWVALWGAGEVCRFTPGGRLDRTLPTGAPHTSSVAFAGDDLRTLVVTTATAELDVAALADAPRSGKLLTVEVDVPGLPAAAWTGLIPTPRTLENPCT